MGAATQGKIKGYVSHDDLLNFIKENYDQNAYHGIKKEMLKSDEYIIDGYFYFNFKGETRQMFYMYWNVNHLENLEYYSARGLEDMVRSETTLIDLGHWGSSIEIIKNIITHFGGGWIDENDCDDIPYYFIEGGNDS